MNYIRLPHENLEKEHICCAISNKKDPRVSSKKRGFPTDWMKRLSS